MKKFDPTDVEREQVQRMAGHGLSHDMIACLVRDGINVKTLTRAFARELHRGRATAAGKIVECLYQKALGGDVASMLFWIKCRLGWREVQRVEVTGSDGRPVLPQATGVMIVPATLDPVEWEKQVSVQQAKLLANPKLQ